MNDIKENLVDTLYKEFLYYMETDEDLDGNLYGLSRILVKILSDEMIKKIINELYRIRKTDLTEVIVNDKD